MHRTNQVGDLQVDQDLEFERKNWRVQSIGWRMIAGVIVLACLGLLGPGPLSDAKVGREDRLMLEYHRFGRMQSTDAWQLHVGPGQKATFQIRISRMLLSEATLVSVVPTPERMVAEGDAYLLEFARAAPEHPTSVTMQFRPDRAGLFQGQVSLVGGDRLDLWRWIHP